MPSSLRRIDGDTHDAPIAPDIVPADWADCVPAKPANDAISRERLFEEIRHAAETVAPKVDNTFRATDVNNIASLDSSSRTWLRRAGTAFAFALISVVAAAVWQHHGDAATQTVAGWVPLSLATSSPATEPSAETAAQPPAEQQTVAAQPAAEAASGTATGFPPEADQQIQSLTRDLAAKTQQVEQLKAQIEQMKASQQASIAPTPPVAPAAPVARPHAPKPQLPKFTALPPRPIPVAPPARPAYQPAMQASAAPPPPVAAAPPAYQPPPYAPPPQATTQPNGEPIVRPPMPMPLSDRY